ncbi:MAG: MerR family transcriptional regulator [Aeromicrobium sp.]|uniref:MerR family transcriptional regulator n=1 Tax=Aeromicrobium sp. TaxID=1871063 RepID=UPI0039E478A6
MDEQTHTVGDLARLAGVTVRTLHHYDEIGLLRPSARSHADYRLYDADDASRLTRVLFYRDLGFGLTEIAALLDGDDDPVVHLRAQHRLLSERLGRVRAMVAALEREMEAHMSGTPLTTEQKLEIFGDDWDPAYEAEAEERWGDTDAWAQSKARTAGFTADDWRQVKADTDTLNADLVAALNDGVEPGSERANALAERHLEQIQRFYDADHAMQCQIASLYTEDARFAATYEKLAPGLGAWLRAVIEANAERG